MTKTFFTSDVHGLQASFMKFLNSARFHRADALVPGGDISGKIIVPIVERLTGLAPQAFNLLNCPMTFERGIQGDKF